VPVAAGKAVEPLVVDEQEHVAPGPAAGVLEGERLLDLAGIDGEVLAVQVGQAVVLPQQGAGHGLAAAQQAGGKGGGGEVSIHRCSFGVLCRSDSCPSGQALVC